MRNAFISALLDLAERNPDAWLLNADLGFSVLEPFAERFPDRYLNVGVAEQNMAGIAAGLGMNGCKVFIYSIGNFPTLRCFEQIRNDICYHDADVKIVSVGAGFAYGAQGYTHHAIEDLGAMRLLPGLKVYSPADPVQTADMVRDMGQAPTPAYLRLGRAGEPVFETSDMTVSERLTPRILREGSDALVLTTGGILGEALEAAEQLSERGVSLAVATVPVLKPLDDLAIARLCGSFHRLFTLEEHSVLGGLYETLLPTLASLPHKPFVAPLAIADGATKGLIGDQSYMRKQCGIDADALMTTILSNNA